ncbi:MAG: transcription-repair coupling factor [Acidimicrobiia bacterium]|nr:transcription-repair coupling factor [Acidimicrobiia bacterium]
MSAPLSALVDAWKARHFPPLPGRWVVASGARAFAIAGLSRLTQAPTLVVVPGERDAEDLTDDLELFTHKAVFMPAWETLPFEHLSPNAATMARRARARHLLGTGGSGTIVVASVRAAVQRLSPSNPAPIVFERNGEHEITELTRTLAGLGYQRTDRVEARGEFAVRGGILDVFPAQDDDAVRIDFWGDTVEDLRIFAVGDQRSADPVDTVNVYPAREFRPDSEEVVEKARRLVSTDPWNASVWDRLVDGNHFAGMESWMPWLAPERGLLDELAPGVSVVVVDPVKASERSRDLQKEEGDLAEALASSWGQGAPEAGEHPALFLDLEGSVSRRPTIDLPSIAASPADEVLTVRGFDATAGDAESIAAALRRLEKSSITAVVAMDGTTAADRVARVLAENDHPIPRLDTLDRVRPAVIGTGIHQGFVLPELGVAVVGEREVAGRRRAHRKTGSRRRAGVGTEYRDLSPGDFVVHYKHGIGRFEGLVSRVMAGVERDYLVIAYAGADRLYVPTDQLAAVTKYTGGETPRVSRMGGKDWAETKSKVRKAVAAVAEEVVRLHRLRAQASGHAFDIDSPWQRELEASFPFEETPDQLSAIADVKVDMESDAPMDRLVFGDVGFGKTEVALRAAFKAATAGKQVAVLCPTTLLAQQHFATFSERFAPYPVRVEMLSRFLTAKEAKTVVAGLATGEVDVVIGTHRLLSDDIKLKALGLLVIDEEQRFGVSAKDQIKKLKIGVDVLTLTATPIPRTLEMALTGIREVSHIRTAPVDRHPILTYAGPFDEQTVAAAIRREMLREGQIFYVHNRVQSIERAVARLRDLVPDARYVVAHGQMSEGQLEQVMLDFWNREYDVMVATTIIESGLDLPQVNTLIVERADLLGLAQLYQLRGRVGRSNQRAYAYLFHPPDQSLTEEAHRRLEAIGEATDLGSGFQLAMRDLEIRGAGSVLGEVQSGHVSAVGFDLYAELVAEAVNKLEGRTLIDEAPAEVRIELPIDAHLPDDYVPDQQLRLEAYRRLALATTHEEVSDVAAEWEDRYGPVPPPARSLTDIAHLRVEALRIGLNEIVKLHHEVRLGPVDLSQSQEIRLQRLARGAVLRAGEGVIFLPAPDDLVEGLLGFMANMWPPPDGKSPSPGP